MQVITYCFKYRGIQIQPEHFNMEKGKPYTTTLCGMYIIKIWPLSIGSDNDKTSVTN